MFLTLMKFLTVNSFAFAGTVGFLRGNDLVATPVQGQVQVTCNGFNGMSHASYTCRDVVLDPQAYDYFVGPQDPRAEKVELIAAHEDGSTRTKMTDYDGRRGRSREAVNLWISTLFQKPLLEYGKNIIRYRLIEDEHDLESPASSQFVVNVKRGPGRVCPVAQYDSTDVNDCNSQYSICQRYFEEYRNCQSSP